MTNQIVADAGSYTTKIWHNQTWVHLQGLARGQRITIPLKGVHLPAGTLCIILQDCGQVAIHYALDEETPCSTRPCGSETVGVDKGYTQAYTDSEGERHGEGLVTGCPRRVTRSRPRAGSATNCASSKPSTLRPGIGIRPTTFGTTAWATRSGTADGSSTTPRFARICAKSPTASPTAQAPSPARI